MGNAQNTLKFISPVASIEGKAIAVGQIMKKVDIDQMTAELMNVKQQLTDVASREQKEKEKEEMNMMIQHWTLAGAVLTVIVLAIKR